MASKLGIDAAITKMVVDSIASMAHTLRQIAGKKMEFLRLLTMS